MSVQTVNPNIQTTDQGINKGSNTSQETLVKIEDASTITSKPKPMAPKDEAVFRVVWNDGAPDHLIALTGAKNIFAAQLPKMPKEYIARLIFNREHRTMCIITAAGVIGGICFRPFYEQKFAEIVFCAITSAEQVKGYGTRIMNHLKEYVKTEGIEYFLTYADNYATGYFKKQGFTKHITMAPDRWRGYVKDYDGGTLMECRVAKSINYLNVIETIKQQREAVYERIQQMFKTHTLYEGLHFPPPHNPQKRVWEISEIPGVVEAGWHPSLKKARPASSLSAEEHEQMRLNARFAAILKSISEIKDSWPFKKPVDRTLVTDYYDIIKEPMDLGVMNARVQNKYYNNREKFEYDMNLIVTNCKSYNAEHTLYHRCATVIEKKFKELIDKHFGETNSE